MGGLGGGIGNPIIASKSSSYEDVTDLSIPVKHGLSLEVRRLHSNLYGYSLNQNGLMALGYSDDSLTNWHLYTYDAHVRRAIGDESLTTGSLLFFIDEVGTQYHFGYAEETTQRDDLHKPYDASWTNEWASVYRPIGDDRVVSPLDNNTRQTSRDIELIITHSDEPESAEERFTLRTGFVLRYPSGDQYHFNAKGELIFIDANYHNNVKYGTAGHVDDYLEIEYSTYYHHLTDEQFDTITRVKAPPSDGRTLEFHHPSRPGGGEYAEVDYVYLKYDSTNYPSTSTSDMVHYDYVASGAHTGRLYRARVGTQNYIGMQYEYGIAELNGGGDDFTVDPDDYYSEHWPHRGDLVRKSNYNFDSQTATAQLVNWRYPDEGIVHMIQLSIDPQTSDWRKHFDLTGLGQTGIDQELLYLSGEKLDESGAYSEDRTQSMYLFNYNHDMESTNYSTAVYKPNQNRVGYHKRSSWNPSTPWVYLTRIQTEREFLVDPDANGGAGAWVETAEYAYANADRGTNKVTSITKYSNFNDLGGNEYEPDSSSAATTTFVYGDNDYPHWATETTNNDETRIVRTFDSLGRLDTVVSKIKNQGTSQWDTFSTTDYDYIATGVNAGLISEIEVTLATGPVRTTTYSYYTSTNLGNGALTGLLSLVTSDDGTTVGYKYDVWGNTTEVETADGATVNTYSGSGQSDTNYPPRLIGVTTPSNDDTDYTFDEEGRVFTITNAIDQTTTFTYDNLGNVIEIESPGAGTTSYVYDIYDRLVSLTDAEGTMTEYDYDAFGRQIEEKVNDVSGYLYKTLYTYVESGSAAGGCGSCGGGGANAIASRSIVNGAATTTETLHFVYDLFGRLTGQGTTSAADDIIYTYEDGRLTSVGYDGSLWADQSFEYEYDEYYRPSKEIYPNGRTIEVERDQAGRLSRLKDPFGFMTEIDYDDLNEGWLEGVSHSSLGEAVLTYIGDDRLSRLTLGNGAYTDYTFDDQGRMIAFDHRELGGTQILKHSWEYDALGRKNATADITISSALDGWTPTKIDITYDTASRLTREKLMNGGTPIWDVQYGYDDVGNRTSLDDGTIDKTLGYGKGNRETSVSGRRDSAELRLQGQRHRAPAACRRQFLQLHLGRLRPLDTGDANGSEYGAVCV